MSQHPTIQRSRSARSGFTLIELSIVIFIIALVSAISVPYLIPIIVFSELEGTARHLAGYGRAAMAEAAFLRTDITVRFDLDNQEWYAIRWILPSDAEAEAEAAAKAGEAPEEDQWQKLAEARASGAALSGERLKESLLNGETTSLYPDDFDQELADLQMQDRVYRYARSITEARAKNVKHEDSFLDEVGPLFNQEFDLDEENQPVEDELVDPLLRRSRIPESVRVEAIEVDGEASKKGVVEFEINMLGFAQEVVFYLVNEDGDYFTVVWNPVSGNTNVAQGNRKPA